MQACRSEDWGRLHGEDLYLATACSEGREAAWILLEREHRAPVRDSCQYYVRRWDDALELADLVWTSLCLPGRGGRPRIASYDGLCSLGTWLRTIVIRRAINYRKKRAQSAAPLDASFDLPDDKVESGDARSSQQQMEPFLKNSLLAACESLDAADCRLLVWRFEEGLQLGEIARRLGVHQSTVTRRIDRICECIRRSATESLAATCRMSRAGITECLQNAGSGGFADLEMLRAIRRRAAQRYG
jgi:RNA polymerase sigma-70 factor (ECF subfamily)